MKLDDTSLPGATFEKKPVKKTITYEYLFSDTNDVEEAGLGICQITVNGTLSTYAERDALEQLCESNGTKKLKFPSAMGQTDDRYYKVYTGPLQLSPQTADVYRYTIECLCADNVTYLTADDSAVW